MTQSKVWLLIIRNTNKGNLKTLPRYGMFLTSLTNRFGNDCTCHIFTLRLLKCRGFCFLQIIMHKSFKILFVYWEYSKCILCLDQGIIVWLKLWHVLGFNRLVKLPIPGTISRLTSIIPWKKRHKKENFQYLDRISFDIQ